MINRNIMKNIVKCNTTVKCCLCNKEGFISEICDGADYVTCPLCKEPDYCSGIKSSNSEIFKKHFSCDCPEPIDDDDDTFSTFKFCPECKIVYTLGCIHQGDEIKNAHFISKWEYKGEIYYGMPCFESVEEWYNEMKNIKVLDMVCPNKGRRLCDKETNVKRGDCSLLL